MRKVLEAISIIALAALAWLTVTALYGPRALPARIAIHFDAAGEADAWGTPHMLLLLPIIALVLYVMITLVSRRPAVFNYPARITPQNRRQLQELALNMIALLKAQVMALFAFIQYFSLRTVRDEANSLPRLLMPLALVVIFVTVALHVSAMRRTVR